MQSNVGHHYSEDHARKFVSMYCRIFKELRGGNHCICKKRDFFLVNSIPFCGNNLHSPTEKASRYFPVDIPYGFK
jgi:hypothetical protein